MSIMGCQCKACRRERKENWKIAFVFFGGITLIVIVIKSLCV